MAKPIKDTPILKGKIATQFLKNVKSNEKQDHSGSYARAKSVYNNFVSCSRGTDACLS